MIKKNNHRYLGGQEGKEALLTKELVKSVHLKYLKRWQKKLSLDHCSFALKAVNNHKKRWAEIYLTNRNRPTDYCIELTRKVFQQPHGRKGWRDSIVHELLHAFVFSCYKNIKRRQLCYNSEEFMVHILSGLLTRQKE